jgi:hypothetical protein
MRATPILPGTRFGSLVAVEKAPDSTHNVWKFRCDCGTDKTMRVYEVLTGRIKSCGCYYLINGRYKKYSTSAESTAARLFSEYQAAAVKRNYSWDLPQSTFSQLILAPCHYCGIPYSMTRNAWLKPDGTKTTGAIRRGVRQEWIDGATIRYNGVDRLNNTQGYSADNCVSCCKFCNIAKGTRTKEEYLECIKRVAHFND